MKNLFRIGIRRRCFWPVPVLSDLIPRIIAGYFIGFAGLAGFVGLVGLAGLAGFVGLAGALDPNQDFSINESQKLILDNGLEVLLLPDAASDLVTVISVIKAGSAYESPRLSGAAHFLEHMLFNGTNRRTQAQLYAAEDGAGGFNNAFTRKTHAAFMMTMPSIELELALDLQSDMLFNSRLPNHKFEKERGIILEEMAKDKENQSYALNRILNRDLYSESTYELPVLGTEFSIATLKRDEVMAFYRRLYNPENITLVLIGGFEEARAVAAIEATFGRALTRGHWIPKPPPPAEIKFTRYYQHQLPTASSHLRVVWNGPNPESESWLAATIATDISFGSMSSPLASALTQQFPGGIVSCNGHLESGFGFSRLVIDVEVTGDTDLETLAAVLLRGRDGEAALIRSLDPPSSEAIEGWKTSACAAEIFSRQRSYMYAPLSSEAVALFGAWGLEGRLGRIAGIADKQVSAAGNEFTAGPYRAILVESTLPAKSDTKGGGSAAKPAEVAGGMPGGAPSGMAAGMPKQMPAAMSASPGSEIDGKTYANRMQPLNIAVAESDAGRDLKIRRIDNASGSKLISIDTPSDGSISIYVMIEGRNYLEPAGKEGITELTHQLLTAGTDKYNENELAARLAAIGGEIQCGDRGFIPFDDYYTDRDFSFIRLQALDMYAAEAFELLAEIIGSPRFPESVVIREKNQLLNRLRRESISAKQVATTDMRQILYGPSHPLTRSPYGTVDGVSSITRDDIVEYHRRLFDPRRCWIGVVSGLPLAEQTALAARLVPAVAVFSDSPTLGMTEKNYRLWQQRQQVGQIAAAHLAELQRDDLSDSPGVVTRKFTTGGEGRGQVIEMLLLPSSAELESGLTGLNADLAAVLGVAGSIVSSDLAFELRERRGLAYGIGAGISRVGDFWLYTASAGTRRENLSEMATGFTALRKGTDEKTESTVKRIAQKRYGRTLRRQAIRLNQAMYSVWDARDGRDPGDWWRQARRGREVSTEAVNQALKLLAETEPSVMFIVE